MLLHRSKVNSAIVMANVKRIFLSRLLSSTAAEPPAKIFQSSWRAPLGHKTDFTVYNSLAKKITPLVLERQNVVKWYSCGPTVYDHSHIGHAFCYVRFDMIRRALEEEGMSVIYAMNITDVDDKIIRKSRELKRDFRELSREYEESFFHDMEMLNVLPPSLVLRVVDFMPEIIDFVQKLFDSNIAYKTSDGIYFDTSKDSALPRFRIVSSEQPLTSEKRNNPDFALWKFAKPDEPSWQTPFGAGRPGWHVECSAIASKVFGSSIDIHSGGKDLEFPHHENEEAQSCSYHECSNWAKFYLHSGHVIFKSEKMSKSLGNVVSIKDYLKHSCSDQFRLMCLRNPWRSDVEFIEADTKSKRKLMFLHSVLSDCDDYLQGKFSADINEEQLLQSLFLTQLKVREALKDNFNFPEATQAVFTLVQALKSELIETEGYSSSAFLAVSSLRDYIRKYFRSFGMQLKTKTGSIESGQRFKSIIDSSVDLRLKIRSEAKSLKPEERGKLLQHCDEFRKEMAQNGILIVDKKDSSVWIDENRTSSEQN